MPPKPCVRHLAAGSPKMWYTTANHELVRYWDLSDKQIANNSRAGSVSVYFAIVNKYGKAEGISGAPTKPMFMLVREPVERFISAKAKGPVPLNTGNHFDLQCDLAIGPKVFLYRFPEQLKQFGQDTGLGEIPWINPSVSEKPVLTESERQGVLERYAADVRLYESIH